MVDVSRDILEMSGTVFPDPRRHPLRDARVTVHVEDGRFFLQQTAQRYDLITGEPPPPKIAGVASLYSTEYFRLLRERLNAGGLATYWLPAPAAAGDTLAIIRAFCMPSTTVPSVGRGLEWILWAAAAHRTVSREVFSRPWRQPRNGLELQRIAVVAPSMAALFMADAHVLREITAVALPLTDNFPRRLSPAPPSFRAEPLYAWLMGAERSRASLEQGDWAAAVLPRALIADSRERFRRRAMLDEAQHAELRRPGYSVWSNVAQLLRDTDLVVLPQWLLASEARAAEIARLKGPLDRMPRSTWIDALVHRRKPARIASQSQFQAATARAQVIAIFHHCLAGETRHARELMAWLPPLRDREPYGSFLAWAVQGCEGAKR